jgi:hypothetical protein
VQDPVGIALFLYLGLFFTVILKRILPLILKLCSGVVRQAMRVPFAGRGEIAIRILSEKALTECRS